MLKTPRSSPSKALCDRLYGPLGRPTFCFEIPNRAWWLNREHLRTAPVGVGSGRTAADIAKELGMNEMIVGHETSDFLAYESITRAHTGEPNVLKSREGFSGEAAALGDGFYTAINAPGARGTRFSIRFKVDPFAREKTDFIYDPHSKFLILLNKAAFKVIPESLRLSLVDYFEVLAESQARGLRDNLGLFEKLKRRLKTKVALLSNEEQEQIAAIVRKHLDVAGLPILTEWVALSVSHRYPDITDSILKLNFKNEVTQKLIVEAILKDPQLRYQSQFPQWVRGLQASPYQEVRQRLLFEYVYSESIDHPEWIEELLQKNDLQVDRQLLIWVLSRPKWKALPHWESWMETLLARGTVDNEIARHILPSVADHPEWIQTLIDRGNADSVLIHEVLSKPQWTHRIDWKKQILFKYLWSESGWQNRFPGQRYSGFEGVTLTPAEVKQILQRIEADSKRDGFALSEQLEFWFGLRVSTQYPEVLRRVIQANQNSEIPIVNLKDILNLPHWAEQREFIELLMDGNYFEKYRKNLVSDLFRVPQRMNQADLLVELIRRISRKSYFFWESTGRVRYELQQLDEVLLLPHWRQYGPFVQACGGIPSVACLSKKKPQSFYRTEQTDVEGGFCVSALRKGS